jgi:hypothetical protein
VNANDSESAPPIDDALMRYMYAYFAASNDELYTRLGYAVAAWASPFSS